MNTLIEILNKLSSNIPVIWDRWTSTDAGYYVAYGWIYRHDGQRDFLMISLQDGEPAEDVFYTTSSAKYSEKIHVLLYGTVGGHNQCKKIEELFKASKELPNEL